MVNLKLVCCLPGKEFEIPFKRMRQKHEGTWDLIILLGVSPQTSNLKTSNLRHPGRSGAGRGGSPSIVSRFCPTSPRCPCCPCRMCTEWHGIAAGGYHDGAIGPSGVRSRATLLLHSAGQPLGAQKPCQLQEEPHEPQTKSKPRGQV